MQETTLAKFIYDKLNEAGWTDLVLDEVKQSISIPTGKILTLEKGEYNLRFFSYIEDDQRYSLREKYSSIIFPKDYDLRNFLWFKKNGNYKLSYENQFKNILNPLGKEIKKIKLKESYKELKFYRDTLMLPIATFVSGIQDAKFVFRKSSSYKSSAENYLTNIKSHDYSKNTKKRTTYVEKGEFNFLIDRLYLGTKTKKADFLRYLNADDNKSIEDLILTLLKFNVLSEDFLKGLNEYFIKEKLKDIIELGREILSLGTPNLKTANAQKIITKMGMTTVGQLESLWQHYFEKNLLYLIFTYKKIFPKVLLKDIEGDKKYPDFIGINHYNGLDIIEIKTHLKNVLIWDNSHKNFYFSPEMSKAIVQTTNYMDAIVQSRFQKTEDQTKITQFTDEENLYHPRGIIVISSMEKLTTKTGEDKKLKRDFTKLRNSLHNIEILTFDEIINIADEYIKNIVPEVPNE